MALWMVEQILLHQVIVPRVTRDNADVFSILLLREGIEPNPGPIQISDPEQRLSERLHRILQESNTRAESPNFASFRKCPVEVSRDAHMTRTPGDGMNTPPPEPKPPDSDRGPNGVYTDTVKDIHPKAVNDVSTHSEAISDCEQVSDRGVDRNKSPYATPSMSGSSLDINYIIAQARAESRVAADTDDDFYYYTRISSSEEDVNSPNRVSTEDRAKPNMNIPNDWDKMADGAVTRSMNDEMPEEEREISYCPTPSMSRTYLDVDNILTQARTESRMAANMDVDFYCNDSDLREDDVRNAGRKIFSLKDKVDMDGERRNNPPRPVSESSLNIEDICAKSRLESRTAFNMDDDFFTNSECSDVDEETRKYCIAREDDVSTMKVRFADVKPQRSRKEHNDTIIRKATPYMHGNVTPDTERETNHILCGRTSVHDKTTESNMGGYNIANTSKNSSKSGGIVEKVGIRSGMVSHQGGYAASLNGSESTNHIHLSPSNGNTKPRSNGSESTNHIHLSPSNGKTKPRSNGSESTNHIHLSPSNGKTKPRSNGSESTNHIHLYPSNGKTKPRSNGSESTNHIHISPSNGKTKPRSNSSESTNHIHLSPSNGKTKLRSNGSESTNHIHLSPSNGKTKPRSNGSESTNHIHLSPSNGKTKPRSNGSESTNHIHLSPSNGKTKPRSNGSESTNHIHLSPSNGKTKPRSNGSESTNHINLSPSNGKTKPRSNGPESTNHIHLSPCNGKTKPRSNGSESTNHIHLSPSNGKTKPLSNETDVSNKHRSKAEINIRTAGSIIHHGNTRTADEINVIEKDVSEGPHDNNNSNFEQYTGRKDTTLVLDCLQTRSLTVAKFRAMFNRTCILLPDTDNNQVDEDLQIRQGGLSRANTKAYTDKLNNKERKRQQQLETFREKVVEINQKATLLLDIQIQRNEGTICERDQMRETDEVPGVKQRLLEPSVVKETDHCHRSTQVYEPRSGTKFTPHLPTGPKPSFVRKRRKYKQMSMKEQMKMKSKIENNEILIPKAPAEKKHIDFKDVSKCERRVHK